MTEEKKARIAVASTVASVLLLFVLIVVLVYQMANYSAIRKQRAILERQKEILEEEISDKEKEIANRKTEWQMEMQARKYGLMFPGDSRFETGND